MGRKTQISKEVILEAALKMLIRDGYAAINIKTLSQEIGCSTQPLVWHFENMEGFRKALSEYALNYANKKMYSKAENPIEVFEKVGREYIKIAVYEPNLFRFLYLDRLPKSEATPFSAIISKKENSKMIKEIASFFDVNEKEIEQYLQNTIIYAHGIATLIATGILTAAEDEVVEMIDLAADAFLFQIGIPKDKIPQY